MSLSVSDMPSELAARSSFGAVTSTAGLPADPRARSCVVAHPGNRVDRMPTVRPVRAERLRTGPSHSPAPTFPLPTNPNSPAGHGDRRDADLLPRQLHEETDRGFARRRIRRFARQARRPRAS